jgi:hypothetical protein
MRGRRSVQHPGSVPAVWYRARSEVRARWRSALGLAVLIGLVAGTALALAAGARRTDTAYPRFLRSLRAWDVAMAATGQSELLRRIASLPQVADSEEFFDGRVYEVSGFPADPGGDPPIDVNYGPEPLGSRINRMKILEGRPPDPDRADEVAISFTAARAMGVGPGDTIRVRFLAPSPTGHPDGGDAPGPTVTFRIVGVEASPGEFPPQLSLGGGSAYATPAFARRYGHLVQSDPGTILRLRHGEDDIRSFTEAVQRLTGGEQAVFMLFQRDNAANVQRSFHLQAVALWIVAGLFALVALVVVVQLLRRRAALEGVDGPNLIALGFRPGQLRAAAALQAAPTAVVAAAVAVVVAVVASAEFPLGLAQTAEPSPGIALDVRVLAGGAAGVALLVLALAVMSAGRAARAGVPAGSGPDRSSRLAGTLGGLGGVTAGLGSRMAFEPGRGRTAVPVRTGLVASVVAVGAVTAALSFGASLSRLLDSPRLYGWNWDVTTQGSITDLQERIVPALRADDRVEAATLTSTGISLTMDDVRADLLLVQPVKGDLQPVVVEGRAPVRPGEVLLGTVTLRKLGARVGDEVPATITGISPSPRPLRVVGRGVLPSTTEIGRLGEGALLRPEALQDLVPAELFAGEDPDEGFDSAAIRFAPGADRDAVLEDLQRLGEVDFGGPEKPSDLVNFGRIERLPSILGGLLAALAAAVLAYLLATSVSRRRRDLAVLKALGLRPRQVRAVVVWEATAVAVVTLVLGVPLGLAGGRWGWDLFASQLGVLSRPEVPALALLLLVPATLVVANVAAALPARAAARLRAAEVLRAE